MCSHFCLFGADSKITVFSVRRWRQDQDSARILYLKPFDSALVLAISSCTGRRSFWSPRMIHSWKIDVLPRKATSFFWHQILMDSGGKYSKAWAVTSAALIDPHRAGQLTFGSEWVQLDWRDKSAITFLRRF